MPREGIYKLTLKKVIMKKLLSLFRATSNLLTLVFISVLMIQSCKSDKKSENKTDKIGIVTTTMNFLAPDTIPSGWNTFEYKNESTETHFFLLDKYPEGKTFADTKKEIFPPFDTGMELINKGKTEEGFAAFNNLPAWFFEVVFSGGSGLISPQNIATTTLNMKPGYYIMECYVKMENGKFHSSMGMAKPLVVSEENSGNTPPEATVTINISSKEGITYDEPIIKGDQTFAVKFNDQIAHENFMGHDVNLIKLSENSDLKNLESWMNWANPKGLISPSPDGITFLGGINDMPAGSTGYFQVNLEPGKYAFISEVPDASSKNMLKTFTISQ